MAIYKHPKTNCSEFLQQFDEILCSKMISNLNENILVIGDFNLNTSRQTKISDNYKTLIKRQSLINMIETATRITSSSETLIDHALIKLSFFNDFTIEKNELEIIDHQPIIISLKTGLNKLRPKQPLTTLKRLFC